jgi:hypothetical protein
MPVFQCVTKTFHGGRLYIPGQLVEFVKGAKPGKHFIPVDTKVTTQPPPPPPVTNVNKAVTSTVPNDQVPLAVSNGAVIPATPPPPVEGEGAPPKTAGA